MRGFTATIFSALWLLLVTGAGSAGVTGPASKQAGTAGYVLGPGDQVIIWALGLDEISQRPLQVQRNGYIDVPLLGAIKAGGLTVEQLKQEVLVRLKREVHSPQAVVSVTEYGSQPVSVLGAVNRAGVHQLQGSKTLLQALSMAEGPRSDAGSTVTITRRISRGSLPLANAAADATGEFSVATVNLASLLDGKNPSDNIELLPNDVISVSRGQIVYVLGEVHKTGGFLLGDRDRISVLQAVTLAEGLGRTASSHKARILRATSRDKERDEIPVDIGRILAGKSEDIALRPDDILYIPNNKTAAIALRATETLISVAAGVVIWRVGVPR